MGLKKITCAHILQVKRQTRNPKKVPAHAVPATYVISSQDGQMEGQELQGDDAEDALQTVHSVRQLDGLVGILTHVGVILAAEDDWPALVEVETWATLSVTSAATLCVSAERPRVSRGSVAMPTG